MVCDKLTGIIHFYDEPLDLLTSCLTDFRNAYPDSSLLLISDGAKIELYDIAKDYNAFYFKGRRWKTKHYGGMWTHRYIELVLKKYPDTEWYVKFDPDTVFTKALTIPVPEEYKMFSSTTSPRSPVDFYGGVTGIRKDFAQQLYDNKYLTNPIFTNCVYTTPRKGEKVAFQDLVITKILHSLNEKVFDHPEIHSRSKRPPNNPENYCIYHPNEVKR